MTHKTICPKHAFGGGPCYCQAVGSPTPEYESPTSIELNTNQRLVINGFDVDLMMPKNMEPILFLVDNDPNHVVLDTWFGYALDGKWFGVAEDNEGWQEMAGTVLRWLPLPEMKL